jgi:transglutaminase-like putative cysteine protease
MQLSVRHSTTHWYESPSSDLAQLLRMTPHVGAGQRLVRWSVRDERGREPPHYVDAFGNLVHLHTRRGRHRNVEIVAEGVVETAERCGIVGEDEAGLSVALYRRSTALTASSAAIAALAGEARGAGGALDELHRLLALVHARLPHRAGLTDPDTPAAEALRMGAGVCQDHAHVFVAAARALGHPARYVSGYLHVEGDDPELASHAWAEAHVDALGWVGFDPSHAVSPSERYVRVGIGRDYADAAPVSGVRRGSPGESLAVRVQVRANAAQ